MQSDVDDDKHPCGAHTNSLQFLAEIVEHQPMARNTFRLRLRAPELAARILPGQFFMVKIPGQSDPLLGRPFALYDIFEEHGRPAGIDFGYLVIGKMTSRMTHWRSGDVAEIWGPLGNGFPAPGAKRLILVAGGIGQTPFLAVAREALQIQTYGTPRRTVATPPSAVTLCYGVRSAEYLAGVDDFRAVPGLDVRVATDDGSVGHHGFVTDLLKQALDESDKPAVVYTCGPEPMLHAVARICLPRAVPCLVSLETPMACGFGACFSCVTRVRLDDGSWDYRRTCIEGPVFPADRLEDMLAAPTR